MSAREEQLNEIRELHHDWGMTDADDIDQLVLWERLGSILRPNSTDSGCCHTPGGSGVDRDRCDRCRVETKRLADAEDIAPASTEHPVTLANASVLAAARIQTPDGWVIEVGRVGFPDGGSLITADWLAKHDAEVGAKVLRDAADAITCEPIPYGASFNSTTDYMAGRAHARLILHARATVTTEVGADG